MARGKRITPWIVILLCFVCLVLPALWLFYSHKIRRSSPPAYEEVYSLRSDLSYRIKRIDDTIYETLYSSGIDKENITFSHVQPRHEREQVWDFTELVIRCSSIQSASELKKTLCRELSSVDEEITVKTDADPEGGFLCAVYVRNFYTHKIIIRLYVPSKKYPKRFLPKIAIIIDDLGYDLDMADSFTKLGMPICMSVLPSAPYTDLIVKNIKEANLELILHLPMEPKLYPEVKPGPGALFLSMSDKEILSVLDEDLEQVPGAMGVNNHMGSSFTEDLSGMSIVLEVLKRKGMYYVDSRTTSGTVGMTLAREIGVPAAERSVFLDNDQTVRSIEIQLERLMNISSHSGYAIGIGHPHRETLEALRNYRPRLEKEFQLVFVSQLLGPG